MQLISYNAFARTAFDIVYLMLMLSIDDFSAALILISEINTQVLYIGARTVTS